MKIVFVVYLLALLLFPKGSNAQLCVVYDADGYVNVRNNSAANAKIIGRIVEGQAFAKAWHQQKEENKPNNWIAVNFPVKTSRKSNNYLRFDGEESAGFVHASRLVELASLPVFKAEVASSSKVIHRHKDIEVIIETRNFKASNHNVIKNPNGGFLIDGETAFPYYGGDAVEIKSILLKQNGKLVVLPEATFRNLFMVTASNTQVYAGRNKEVYINFDAGDGADGYNIVYCLKDGKLFSMTVTTTLP